MKKRILFVFALCLLMNRRTDAQTNNSPFALSTQLVLVTTKGWDAVPGEMRRFKRTDTQSPWTQVGAVIPIVVGRSGLGWGRGLNPATNPPGPIKHEGDGKSPAGIFRLSSAFGLAPAEKMKSVKLPYRELTNGVECVDDPKSTRYNSITDRTSVTKVDWDSSEKMRAIGGPYRLGIVVDQDMNPPEPGGGSCVFIHLWDNDHTGTSGCTAMAPTNMEMLLPWLDPAAKPVFVQLTESDHQQLKSSWHLP